MVSFMTSDPQTVHKRRRGDGSSPQHHTVRHRKQKLTSRLSDSGFEDELLFSSSPDRADACSLPSADAEIRSGQLSSWYLQYGDIGYKIQKEKEAQFHPCKSLASQPQLNAEDRCKLVSWLIPVHKHLSLSFECCCLTVNIMDRFLASTPVAADCFQLLGVTALLLASKQVEVCSPRISHLLSLCCDAFNKEQLCNLECLILVRLDFRLAAPTLAFFLDCYTNFKTAPLISGNNVDSLNKDSLKISSRHCRKLAQKLCELSLADYAFNKYPPSLTASCALNLSIEIQQQGPMLSQEDHWDSFMEESNDAHNLIDGVIISSKSCQASTSHMESTDYSLIQECRNNLRLLVSLNQEALKIW